MQKRETMQHHGGFLLPDKYILFERIKIPFLY